MRGWLLASSFSLMSSLGATVFQGCPIELPEEKKIEKSYDFRDGKQGWTALFADYTADMEDDVDAEARIADLPAELEIEGTGYLLGGSNVSDDLVMLLYRKLDAEDGIAPNTNYEVSFTVTFASNAPKNCAGIGGAPGEAVYLKVGGADVAPDVSEQDNDLFRLNIDIGQQAGDGINGSTVDDIANNIACEDVEDLENAPYQSLVRTFTHKAEVESNAAGELWLVVATDSGYEGRTELYYQKIKAELTPTE